MRNSGVLVHCFRSVGADFNRSYTPSFYSHWCQGVCLATKMPVERFELVLLLSFLSSFFDSVEDTFVLTTLFKIGRAVRFDPRLVLMGLQHELTPLTEPEGVIQQRL